MLTIKNIDLQQIYNFVKKNYPEECCGILLGIINNENKIVKKIFTAENINKDRRQDRYEINPKDFLKAEIYAKENNLQIVGFFHSHPDHPALASATDLSLAWETYSYLIVSVSKNGIEDNKSWKMENNNFKEEEIQIQD